MGKSMRIDLPIERWGRKGWQQIVACGLVLAMVSDLVPVSFNAARPRKTSDILRTSPYEYEALNGRAIWVRSIIRTWFSPVEILRHQTWELLHTPSLTLPQSVQALHISTSAAEQAFKDLLELTGATNVQAAVERFIAGNPRDPAPRTHAPAMQLRQVLRKTLPAEYSQLQVELEADPRLIPDSKSGFLGILHGRGKTARFRVHQAAFDELERLPNNKAGADMIQRIANHERKELTGQLHSRALAGDVILQRFIRRAIAKHRPATIQEIPVGVICLDHWDFIIGQFWEKVRRHGLIEALVRDWAGDLAGQEVQLLATDLTHDPVQRPYHRFTVMHRQPQSLSSAGTRPVGSAIGQEEADLHETTAQRLESYRRILKDGQFWKESDGPDIEEWMVWQEGGAYGSCELTHLVAKLDLRTGAFHVEGNISTTRGGENENPFEYSEDPLQPRRLEGWGWSDGVVGAVPEITFRARLPDGSINGSGNAFLIFLKKHSGMTPKKCLVLDLDGVMWMGTLDEGLQHIWSNVICERLQKKALELQKRGVLLAINSKNDPELVLRALRGFSLMGLRPEHFAVIKANLQDKAANLREIARELNIGLDSIVFLDDQAFEREWVRMAIPEVDVPDFPTGNEWPNFLANLDASFAQSPVTEEDTNRTDYIRQEHQRRQAHEEAASYEAYLAGLRMELSVSVNDASQVNRMAQLTLRTNQFNLTNRRYTSDELSPLLAYPESTGTRAYTFHLRDRIGDSGTVGVVIARRMASAVWHLDTFCLSCRAMGRGVEYAMLGYVTSDLEKKAAAKGIIGEYVATERNQGVADFYQARGFTPEPAKDGGSAWKCEFGRTKLPAIPDWIQMKGGHQQLIALHVLEDAAGRAFKHLGELTGALSVQEAVKRFIFANPRDPAPRTHALAMQLQQALRDALPAEYKILQVELETDGRLIPDTRNGYLGILYGAGATARYRAHQALFDELEKLPDDATRTDMIQRIANHERDELEELAAAQDLSGRSLRDPEAERIHSQKLAADPALADFSRRAIREYAKYPSMVGPSQNHRRIVPLIGAAA